MTAVIVGFAGLFGLLIGSFLNVVIGRVPAGESIMGRSHCPRCLHPIAPYDNIPIASWLILRGKCRHCRAAISPQYILVEAVTGVAFAVIVATFGVTVLTATLLYLAAVSIALAVIDYQTMRLPDVLTLPSIAVIAIGLTVDAAVTGAWDSAARAAVTAVALTAAYAALWAVTGGRGLGFGDVKLAPTIAAATGYLSLGVFIVGTAAGWIVGAVIALTGMAAGKVKMGKALPFGPALIIGTWIGIFAGPDLWEWYSHFLPG